MKDGYIDMGPVEEPSTLPGGYTDMGEVPIGPGNLPEASGPSWTPADPPFYMQQPKPWVPEAPVEPDLGPMPIQPEVAPQTQPENYLDNYEGYYEGVSSLPEQDKRDQEFADVYDPLIPDEEYEDLRKAQKSWNSAVEKMCSAANPSHKSPVV